jgi:glycosyltransferase involved in cell wall biosynthesis
MGRVERTYASGAGEPEIPAHQRIRRGHGGMSGPLVSIVTPSYNQGRYLEEAIESVLDQDYERLEYIVVDDGSSDGSPGILERYADRLTCHRRTENTGQAAALNFGFACASGELLGFLNSDDTLLPGAVATMAEELSGDPSLDLVYGDALYTDAHSQRTGYLAARDFDPAEMVRTCDNHLVQPSTLWRREAWNRLGPLNEQGWYFFDFEFFLRFPPERVRRIAKPLSSYRIHVESKSSGWDGSALARDHARLAETFFAGDLLPQAARAVAAEGRSRAYLLGAEFAYEAMDLPRARRYVRRAMVLHPPHLGSSRWLSLLGKAFLPRPLVARLRARRRSSDLVPFGKEVSRTAHSR